jgi:hypothetical protein
MCKLLIMTGIAEGLVAEEFMRRMAIPMSKTNAHGIGYTAVGPDGELFSQRWLNNEHFFDKSNVMTPEIAEALKPYESRLPKGALENNYSELGNIDFSNVRTVTMHTRFATCGREFANTHPFIYEDTSLIHNGSISNAFSTHYRTGLDVNKISTCDSEAALQVYLSQGVNLDTTQAKKWLDILSGSWAFGVLSRNAQGNRILDVIRGLSSLYYMEIDGLGKVFTTNDDDAKAVVKDMGLTFVKDPIFVASDEMYRYDAITGEFLESVDIKPVYKYSGSEHSKRGGRNSSATANTTTSTSQSAKSSQSSGSSSLNVKRPGEALIALVDGFRDDPDAMSLMPDIFTENSSIKNINIDFRKVKKYCNDTKFPFLERLDVFDLVFNSSFVDMYQSLPPVLKEYVRETDERQGCKAARGQITMLYDKREQSMA